MIEKHGADLVVHGHEHQDLVEALPGPDGTSVPVRGVASGTYFHNKPERTARYRVFEIEGGQIRSDHVRVWDKERGVFERQDPDLEPKPGT